ncbi:hypothetical protein ROLI_034370 [Roseobacter fucihabitans]|uniref:Flagellar FliJ protein n=1 Tax=Roseobacter fucihabitans TaxID=1537242 RepID=A0ABZ2BY00_9RHOB|nr:hypothetical protein [Roseobacter litoralis]MBC6968259.1 hypothetical protein [Roseobacter litoralis]
MNLDNLKEIHALVEARYETRRQAFQRLVKKENDLRQELRRLDDQARSANLQGDTDMQTIGADVIWKAWVGKAKTSLNIKLALILAEKEQHIRQVKQAYGKVIAAEKLIGDLSREQIKRVEKKSLDDAMIAAIFGSSSSQTSSD